MLQRAYWLIAKLMIASALCQTSGWRCIAYIWKNMDVNIQGPEEALPMNGGILIQQDIERRHYDCRSCKLIMLGSWTLLIHICEV